MAHLGVKCKSTTRPYEEIDALWFRNNKAARALVDKLKARG
jgi:hypothetical protein